MLLFCQKKKLVSWLPVGGHLSTYLGGLNTQTGVASKAFVLCCDGSSFEVTCNDLFASGVQISERGCPFNHRCARHRTQIKVFVCTHALASNNSVVHPHDQNRSMSVKVVSNSVVELFEMCHSAIVGLKKSNLYGHLVQF